MANDITDTLSLPQRVVILGCCAVGTAVLIWSEAYFGLTVPLGGLLFLPLLVSAVYLPRFALFLFAIAIAVAREYFGPRPWQPDGPVRLAISVVAFAGGGLFAGELIRNRRLSRELVRRTKQERNLRLEAEQDSRALVDSSPAAMMIVDSECRIAKANRAARELLGFTVNSPEGDPIEKYIPMLADMMRSNRATQLTPATLEARGRRIDGEEIYLNGWVSLYSSVSGLRLTAILLDVTEQLRNRAEAGLRQLLVNSRIIAGAVSHELRNLAAAASILHLNMKNVPGIRESADYKALGTVIESVRRLSSTELSESAPADEELDLVGLLRELRTIIAPEYDRSALRLEWEVAEDLPRVRAERAGLLQVLLNIAQNSRRALDGSAGGALRVTAYALPESVLIRLSDNGPGISSAERLFQPFQPGASATGLGLFVSRAIIRTFGGELHHTQRPGECCFIIEFPRGAAEPEEVCG